MYHFRTTKHLLDRMRSFVGCLSSEVACLLQRYTCSTLHDACRQSFKLASFASASASLRSQPSDLWKILAAWGCCSRFVTDSVSALFRTGRSQPHAIAGRLCDVEVACPSERRTCNTMHGALVKDIPRRRRRGRAAMLELACGLRMSHVPPLSP